MDAADQIRAEVGESPEVALVLGSGSGGLTGRMQGMHVIEGNRIVGYPIPGVRGHHGRLLFGTWEGKRVVVQQGRVHRYEGRTVCEVTFAVRLMHAIGARHLVITNAAGGINRTFSPGTVMFIADQINLNFAGRRGSRRLYDEEWLDRAEAEALRSGIATRRGTYLRVLGPSYETPAEILAFSRLGADAVGMSTVDEVAQAAELGMRVLGISTITNMAAGISQLPLAHDEVLSTGARVTERLGRLIAAILRSV